MQRYGFIHGMMDVKILVLFVLARVDYPLTMLETYELCYQDDCVSYFDVCTAMDEMVRSGHLACSDGQTYTITEKGRRDGGVTAFVRTEIRDGENGSSVAVLSLDDEMGNLMTLQLTSPNEHQARQLTRAFQKNAELFYNLIMSDLLEEAEG